MFELSDADEYTYKYMADNTDVFGYSDVNRVFSSLTQKAAGKLDALRDALASESKQGRVPACELNRLLDCSPHTSEFHKIGSGNVDATQLKAALDAAGIDAVKQEAVTVVRELATEGHSQASVSEIVKRLSSSS